MMITPRQDLQAFFRNFLGERLEGIPPAQLVGAVAELVDVEEQGLGVLPAAQRLEPFLLAADWRWPEFETWQRRFQELGGYPVPWAGLEGAPPLEPTGELERWTRLSIGAKRLLVGSSWPMPVAEFQKRSQLDAAQFHAALSELEVGRLARRLRSPSERIELLSMDELRAIAKQRGIRGGRRKADVAERLRAALSDDELEALLPPRACAEGVVIEGLPSIARPWLEFQRAKILLLAQTVLLAWSAARNLRQVVDSSALVTDLQLEILSPGDHDPCPVCPPRAGARIVAQRASEAELPPFHPGCRCTTVPWCARWESALKGGQ